MKPRKYCGKRLIERTKELSTKCFELSVDEIIEKFNVDLDLYPRASLIGDMRSSTRILRRAFGATDELHPQIDLIKEEVDSLYLEKLCSLKTKDIEDIIWADDQKKFRRATRTLNALASELTRRAIMGDAPVSDSNIYEEIAKAKTKKTKKSKKKRKKSHR